MGDRSNLYLENGDSGVGVYAHWAGLDMARAAQAVLENPAFRARIGDANYATRIAVQTVLEVLGADSKEDTGFGIWTNATGPDDNEHAFIVIDVNSGDVFVTENWSSPEPNEKVESPTGDEIAARMSTFDAE